MNVHVSSSAYQFAHGKQPRGHGSWAFYMGPSRVGQPDQEPVWFPYGSYSDARRQAVAYAKANGYAEIRVAS